MTASLQVLRKLCSILFFYVLFVTLLAQKTLSVITYNPGRTIEYQRDVILPAQPALRPGIRLSQSGSFVYTVREKSI